MLPFYKNPNVILIGFIVVFFLMLSGTFFTDKNVSTTSNPQEGILQTLTGFPDKKSIEIHSLNIISITPSPSVTAGGTINNTQTPCDPPSSIASDMTGLVSTIKQNYGIILGGDALTVARAQAVYMSMCLAFESSAYQKNLNSLAHPVTVNFMNRGTCFAYTYLNPTRIEMQEPCDTTLVDKYVLIHELTHVMQYESSLGRNAHVSEWNSQVWDTEKNHRIPTGPCMFEDSGNGGECEADAVAEYIYYKVYRNSWSGKPAGAYDFSTYASSWPKWYKFVGDTFFGGVTY